VLSTQQQKKKKKLLSFDENDERRRTASGNQGGNVVPSFPSFLPSFVVRSDNQRRNKAPNIEQQI